MPVPARITGKMPVPPGLSMPAGGHRCRRGGFTLVEMLVALAVTVIALAIVTVVFNVATKTATQAAAVAEVESLIRSFMLQIEQDLKHCDPTDSILVMVGRTQAAALTQDDLDAGRYYRVLTGNPNSVPAGFQPEFTPGPIDPLVTQHSDPRADILMFFSNRSWASQAPPTASSGLTPFQQSLQDGAKVTPIQVVYGHAALDDAVLSGGPGSPYVFAGNLGHIEQIIGGSVNPDRSRIPANRWHLARRATIIGHDPNDVSFLNDLNEMTRILRCYSDQDAFAGDVGWLDVGAVSSVFSDPTAVSLQRAPYVFPTNWPSGVADVVCPLLYASGADGYPHHVATVLETPPANLRSNLGLHMLPGCVWCQVEFLMPEDPRNSLDHPDAYQRNDMPRWTEVQAGSTYVFVPDTAANREAVANSDPATERLRDFALVDPSEPASIENRRIRMWPYAIRVTVRVHDPQGRLDQPVERSLVHRFD
jgi:prepilin-type N-terminal cleavage/methylation domain-containing protein